MAGKQNAAVDSTTLENAKVLAAREERILHAKLSKDLDLGLNPPQKPPSSAAELLRDEWDRKAFGEVRMATRTMYGPDPLLANCPGLRERLEKYGKEDYANAAKELILKNGENGVSGDVQIRQSIARSIVQFGKEATAQAFFDRIMRIPSRTVEFDLDEALDPLLANPMREAVDRYGRAGFAVKFMSEACNARFGLRGYQIVKDANGDPVKIGTLLMGEIPTDWAERRRQHWADESRNQIAEQENNYQERAAQTIRDSNVRGVAPLMSGESIRPSTALNDEWLNESRETGIKVG